VVTLHDILERARASGQKLSPGEALCLFAAVTRLAAEKKATLRSRLVQIDQNGALQVSRFDEKRPEDEPGYLAPELLEKGGPRKDEPRVQVYAAGALGYELLTGHPPDPRTGPGPELTGPAADVVRIALSRDRRERFGDLGQLREAVDALQPANEDLERHMFAALAGRGDKAGMAPDVGRAALTKLIEHVGQLGRQMEAVRSGMADLQRDQRDLLARVAVLESRGEAAAPSLARPRSGVLLSVLTGMGSAAFAVMLIAAIALKVPRLHSMARLWVVAAAPASTATPPASVAGSPVAPASVAPAATPAVATTSIVPPPQPAAISSAPPPSAAPTPATTAPAAAATTAAAPPDESRAAPAAETAPAPKPSKAESARAIAEAQVRRGDQELERGRYDAAAEEFQLALANDPALAVAWRGLGIAHLMRHNEESARNAYAKYLQLAPGAPDARDIRKAIAELNARAKIGSGAEK